MKFVSEFSGSLRVKTQLSKMIKGVGSVDSPTNSQEYTMQSEISPWKTFAKISMLQPRGFQLGSRSSVLTLFYFNQFVSLIKGYHEV